LEGGEKILGSAGRLKKRNTTQKKREGLSHGLPTKKRVQRILEKREREKSPNRPPAKVPTLKHTEEDEVEKNLEWRAAPSETLTIEY